MLVTEDNFSQVIEWIELSPTRALDTETRGLRPYHGETLFSVIIACKVDGILRAFYFDFNELSEHPLPKHFIKILCGLFENEKVKWYLHNAKFDMHQLWCSFGAELKGIIYCTQTMGRVEYNEHFGKGYTLEASLARIGLKKDDAVAEYVSAHKLKEKIPIPGKKDPYELLHYERVPLDIMLKYGCADAIGTYSLGEFLEESIAKQAAEQKGFTVKDVEANEIRLTKAVFNMERVGVRIDRDYCRRAADYEGARYTSALAEFKALTGLDFKASAKVFETVFADQKDKWQFTEKGNPSFAGDVLESFSGPVVKEILSLRDAKAKQDFYFGFLWHADANGDVHPTFNPSGTLTGRFTSSDPNFQNLTAEPILICANCSTGHDEIVLECDKCRSKDLRSPEFLIRRAIVPRPGYCFFLPDYRAMEYAMMFDYAKLVTDSECRKKGIPLPPIQYYELLRQMKEEGMDPHKATAQMMGITRGQAKTINFGLLYGMGVEKLSVALGVTYAEAAKLKNLYFEKLPYVQLLLSIVSSTAKSRGSIKNWFGRKSYFPSPNLAYKASNSLIQGGCADVVKRAMVDIDEYLLPLKSRMVMTVHDEIPAEIHESEVSFAPQKILEIMQAIYPANYLPLTSTAEYSYKNLADKMKGFPS